MSTQTVVDEIKLKAPAWARDGSTAILQKLDQCQRFMLSKACLQNIVIDEATGQRPWLATTDDIFTYEMADVTRTMDGIPRTLRIARVLEVYIPNGNVDEYRLLLRDPLRLGSGAIAEVTDDRLILNATCTPATESVKAKVIFALNPGTFTEKYRILALLEPLRLTEDTIPFMVEEQWEPDLIEGALALIERADYGRSDRWNYFVQDACNRFWYQGNEGTHINKKRTTTPRAI